MRNNKIKTQIPELSFSPLGRLRGANMDFKDQLKNLFPEHEETAEPVKEKSNIWLQDDPIICKYEKRKGKPITILEGYTGATSDFGKRN